MIALRWTTFALFLLTMFAVGVSGERNVLVMIFAAVLFVAHCWTYRKDRVVPRPGHAPEPTKGMNR